MRTGTNPPVSNENEKNVSHPMVVSHSYTWKQHHQHNKDNNIHKNEAQQSEGRTHEQ